MKRLAIITTHPIQYNAPLFNILAESKIVDLKVFYTWGSGGMNNKFDTEFGKKIDWDIPYVKLNLYISPGFKITCINCIALKNANFDTGVPNI